MNCRTADKNIWVKFKPNKKELGTYKYKVQLKKQTINGLFNDPVSIRVEHENGLTRVASSDGCQRAGGPILACK
ncbi:MAG: hypothetical protein P8R42_29070 [Candidatus Binatia bacterium]|nr:hypothetical protein [Candidatus Binatia bacterium]